MNPATKRHLELQIKTLQNAPRDPDKLERLLKTKRRQKRRGSNALRRYRKVGDGDRNVKSGTVLDMQE